MNRVVVLGNGPTAHRFADRLRHHGHAGPLTLLGTEPGATHHQAFLDSLLLTSEITPDQRVCLAAELPDGLLSSITVSVLTQEELDDALASEYARALDACAR